MFAGKVFAIEIYASGALAELGLHIFVPIEHLEGKQPWADTRNPWVRAVILCCIEVGLIWYVHLATPCKLWSGARTSGTSSVPVDVVYFTLAVLRKLRCFNLDASRFSLRGIAKIFVTMENPRGSPLFEVPVLVVEFNLLGMFQVLYSCCAFGATYRKPNEIRTNIGEMRKIGVDCKDLPPHRHKDRLEGTVTVLQDGVWRNVWKTALAAAYPPDLCRAWAKVINEIAPAAGRAERKEISPLNDAWQHWLMEVTDSGHSNVLAVPECPAHFVVPWEGATSVWSHRESKGMEQRMITTKSPSGLKKRPSGLKK